VAKKTIVSLIITSFAIMLFVAGGAVASPDVGTWSLHRDPDFGFSIRYPSDLFEPLESDTPSFHYFMSRDRAAKLFIGAWNNRERRTPASVRQWLLENGQAGDDVVYAPHGRSWFVLSGYHQEKIYYEKVMFTCAGDVVSIFGINYPIAERKVYDPIVERMEDAFTPSPNCSIASR
jgi:hypothetical protein